ncbi:hypothetical protein K503DRAFT_722080 [Rhizopogon vinicolor AM-OR11-026]|uniref:Mitochondrial adapter protein MCP1 transmembrane domain-containing protein n=1 Tax=Rhizopogon vinicolor AM-OR11-026 TaxID=1314800 RepID=A0A1B7MTX1_9AGAM|nr:hypothetical protein K503DRAFT_722080 [Rhizopogon vinicolor AM-OR11-026]
MVSAQGDNARGSKRRQAEAILTNVAHISAPFLSVFILIHLSAPALANVGGSSLSSNVMLLGREYYQTSFGERYLLFAPLAAHVASSIAKRIIAPRSASPRKITSSLSLAAYSTLLIFLPIHFFTHRLSPTDPSAPIFAVGPSELDFEFVKMGLARFPWRSWVLYGGLVASVMLHAVEGAQIIQASRFASRDFRMRPRTRKIVAGAVLVPILAGLWTVSQEPLMVFASLAERYEAVFMQSWVYGF